MQGHPPEHPKLDLSQSISCCIENQTSYFFLRNHWPYILPAVLKVQQDPQLPWSFTEDTAPCCYQFHMSGISVLGLQCGSFVKLAAQFKVKFRGITKPKQVFISALVISVNLVRPQTAVPCSSKFSLYIQAKLFRYTANLQNYIAYDLQFLLQSLAYCLKFLYYYQKPAVLAITNMHSNRTMTLFMMIDIYIIQQDK